VPARSKLISMKLRNLGCIGPEGLEVALDDIVCLVGRNNTGKTTVLHAYELAVGNLPLAEHDRCQWTPEGDFPEVELVVHIPDGTPNVGDQWKETKDGLKLVKSRWQWKEVQGKPIRQTWDPSANGGGGEWAEDGKAGGADAVFNSRLPQPVRVGSLQDSISVHDELLKLVTQPVAAELKRLQDLPGSPLRQAVSDLVAAAMAPVVQFQNDIDQVGAKVGTGFKGVFPELDIRIKVGMEPPNIDAAKSLAAGSSIRFIEGTADTAIKQQGTGSRRAVFWALLQVRNTIDQERKARDERLKEASKLRKELEKEQKKPRASDEKLQKLQEDITALEEPLGGLVQDYSFPGYILLLDEPENALHPMAVRAARDHLYTLSRDPNWQIMLSTHSPFFINPLEDHTTILRLEREGKNTTPKTFRTSTANFSNEDRANLRALLQLDTALAEMFFGSYPVVVEGDTELAAYLAAIVQESDTLAGQVTLIPARGKGLIEPLVKLLSHFRVHFGVLHDTDSPMRRDEKKNGAWTVNESIATAICDARSTGLEVRHRVSVPNFERRLGGDEETKDKPIIAYRRVRENAELRNQIRQLFLDLYKSANHQPDESLTESDKVERIVGKLQELVSAWATREAPNDPRFKFSAT
jgi:putative ATP-dependent endonuclease of the OLD family